MRGKIKPLSGLKGAGRGRVYVRHVNTQRGARRDLTACQVLAVQRHGGPNPGHKGTLVLHQTLTYCVVAWALGSFVNNTSLDPEDFFFPPLLAELSSAPAILVPPLGLTSRTSSSQASGCNPLIWHHIINYNEHSEFLF